MVSVADTGDNLVLMGVDATYCVVDEVNTTASALHDVFLQEAISSASNGGNLHAILHAISKQVKIVIGDYSKDYCCITSKC